MEITNTEARYNRQRKGIISERVLGADKRDDSAESRQTIDTTVEACGVVMSLKMPSLSRNNRDMPGNCSATCECYGYGNCTRGECMCYRD